MSTATDDPGNAVTAATWGDVALVILLLVGLGIALVFDVSAFSRQQKSGSIANFPLLQPKGSVFVGNSEFLPAQTEGTVRLENFTPAVNSRHPLRHGLGPVSTIEIYSTHTRAHVDFTYDNRVPGQEITVRCNDEEVEHLTGLPVGTMARHYPLTLRQGSNRFTVSYARFNHSGSNFAPADPRPIAGSYRALSLYLD